jgi:hypothetical protein
MLVLIILWPALSATVGVFSKGYFSFWVLISLAWGFGATIVITVLPITESKDELLNVFKGMWCAITGREHIPSSSEVARHHYEEEHLKEKLEEKRLQLMSQPHPRLWWRVMMRSTWPKLSRSRAR